MCNSPFSSFMKCLWNVNAPRCFFANSEIASWWESKICYYSLAAKSSGNALRVISPKLEYRCTRGTSWWCSTPREAAYGLAVRCAVWHGPSRELGPCAKLDGLSCMHQLFPGRAPHQLYFVALERGILCVKAKWRVIRMKNRTPPKKYDITQCALYKCRTKYLHFSTRPKLRIYLSGAGKIFLRRFAPKTAPKRVWNGSALCSALLYTRDKIHFAPWYTIRLKPTK